MRYLFPAGGIYMIIQKNADDMILEDTEKTREYRVWEKILREL